MIQVPRLFGLYKKMGVVNTFADMLRNIFQPVFEAVVNPEANRDVFMALHQVTGWDSVDDESVMSKFTTEGGELPDPEDWTQPHNPPYSYWMYYMYANIRALNELLTARGLRTMAYRPHSGEAGSISHLASTYLLAESINHGIMLKKSPVLQYLFYLKQIGLAMSPLSNNALFLELAKNPFPQYFKIGMNVSLSTDDPLMFHYTDEPLLEEYSIAAHVWKMSNVDLCEIARLSVLMSNFEPQYKRHWLGSSYKRPGPAGNSARHTNLPNMRVQYRHDTLRGELGFLDDVIKYRDDPAKAEIAAAHLNAMINNRRANEDDAGSVHFTHTPFSTDYSPQKCRDEPSILTPQLIMPPGGPLHAQEDHHGGEWRCPVSPTMSAIDADRARPQRKGRTVSDHSSVGWATTTSPRLDAEQRPSSPPAMPGLLPPNTD
ncbi:unnamed protein product [Vitrella brassicaformis CCMP3155]|uniref:AMP deaminase n=1 Tax=Vitrella brassicaformis (strain CCMP3155) TaxID=1169540 RepID=A0A0G4ET17_VITBC|nr:unnamed protein product [Vitrella brassicaformis CCMP3155]|eukprot:CEM01066.1 unnamed protein product [Vitrella brassicaformis CCMP3155]